MPGLCHGADTSAPWFGAAAAPLGRSAGAAAAPPTGTGRLGRWPFPTDGSVSGSIGSVRPIRGAVPRRISSPSSLSGCPNGSEARRNQPVKYLPETKRP